MNSDPEQIQSKVIVLEKRINMKTLNLPFIEIKISDKILQEKNVNFNNETHSKVHSFVIRLKSTLSKVFDKYLMLLQFFFSQNPL